MKPKKFSQRLSLNKKTIANLNWQDMKNVYGGDPRTLIDCIITRSCPTNDSIDQDCSCGTIITVIMC